MLTYFAVFLLVLGWDFNRRRWTPQHTVVTEHYTVYSTATRSQTEEIAAVAEILYAAYKAFLSEFHVTPSGAESLKMKLFKDRDEFRFCNRARGWAEAFYRRPYCYQYYSAGEVNPYHWMLHEATHQLNEEVAGFHLAKWLDEGIADYFGTSLIVSNRLCLGKVDANTYPVWWIDTLATTGDLEADKRNVSIIPLRMIISDSGVPDIDKYFNLYYLHWWSLMHFLFEFEKGKYRKGVALLFSSDCGPADFEKYIGNIEVIEREWYSYVLALKREILATESARFVR